MCAPKPFPFAPVLKAHHGQGSEARQNLVKRNCISTITPIFVIRPKATARYNEMGEQILPAVVKAIRPKDLSTMAPQGVIRPNNTQPAPTIREPQREGKTNDGNGAPTDELVLATPIHSLHTHVTAMQDSPPFKHADEEEVADITAASELLLHARSVEAGPSEESIAISLKPPSARVELESADVMFQRRDTDVVQVDCRPFKQVGTGPAYTREFWLQTAVDLLDHLVFSPANYPLPPVNVTLGFPSKNPLGKVMRAVGECWHSSASSDGVNQIFISPTLTNAMDFLDTLVHELVHAIDDCRSGHKGKFQTICNAIGLTEERAASASAGTALFHTIEKISRDIGPYPFVTLSYTPKPPRRSGLPMMLVCPRCEFRCRAAQYQIIKHGFPICSCGERMTEEWYRYQE